MTRSAGEGRGEIIRVGLIALVLVVACSGDGKDGSPAMSASSGGAGGGTAAAGASGSGTGGSGAGSGGMQGATDAGAGGAGGMHGSDAGRGGGSGNASKDAGTKDAGAVVDAATNNPASCPATMRSSWMSRPGVRRTWRALIRKASVRATARAAAYRRIRICHRRSRLGRARSLRRGVRLRIPELEAACNNEGAACFYGSCCVQNATCKNGAWTVGPPMCPP